MLLLRKNQPNEMGCFLFMFKFILGAHGTYLPATWTFFMKTFLPQTKVTTPTAGVEVESYCRYHCSAIQLHVLQEADKTNVKLLPSQ